MAVPKDFLWDTLEAVVAELERADPQSVIGARTRGLLDARRLSLHTTDRHKRADRTERDDRVASLYLSGKSTYDVSRELGLGIGVVRTALARRGVKARPAGENSKTARQLRNKPRIELIRSLRADGKTLEEIGTELHITRERVRQICVQNGIPAERGLAPDQKQAVAEYVSGESMEQVSARHKVAPQTLRGWITKEGFTIRPSNKTSRRDPATLERSRRAAEMYESGKSVREISEALGYGHEVGGVVYRLLAIAGVKPDRAAFNSKQQEAA